MRVCSFLHTMCKENFQQLFPLFKLSLAMETIQLNASLSNYNTKKHQPKKKNTSITNQNRKQNIKKFIYIRNDFLIATFVRACAYTLRSLYKLFSAIYFIVSFGLAVADCLNTMKMPIAFAFMLARCLFFIFMIHL